MEEPIHASQIRTGFPALTASENRPDQNDSRSCSLAADEAPPISSTSALVYIPKDLSSDDETNSFEGYGYDETLTYDHGYNSSSSSTGHSKGSGIIARDLEDENLAQRSSRTSSHSSVSSIPASVLVHSHDTGSKPFVRRHEQHHPGDHWAGNRNTALGRSDIRSHRYRKDAFWKPSSVRAIQMNTEDESDEYSTQSRRRGGGARLSDVSSRSAGPSPMKRLSGFSPSKSAGKQDVQREYPLVLLHCTLLPPSLPVAGFTGRPTPEILKNVLPRKYWQRWKLLEEKVGSGILRDRGVLISHPQDNYDLLEERLLESLELQRPRLHHGHFLAQEEYDSDKEEDIHREESGTDDEQGDVCPDCGGRVITCDNQSRRWDVRVFAANGLMRAGAWAAAWKEMEKVDVEVGLSLPADVRRQLERRLMEDEMVNREDNIPQGNVPSGEAADSHLSRSAPMPNPVDSATGALLTPEPISASIPEPAPRDPEYKPVSQTGNRKQTAEIDFQKLLVNYIRVLASDKRNIVITLLGVVVAFFAIGITRSATAVREEVQQEMFGSASSSAVGVSQYPSVISQHSSVQSWDTSFGSVGIPGSIPTSAVPASDTSAADELYTGSPETVEPEESTVSFEVPAVSMPTATATPLELPAEQSSANPVPTGQPDAPTHTEQATTAADPTTIQDLPDPSESPPTGPVELEANALVDINGTGSILEILETGDDETNSETQSEEVPEPGTEETEETTLQD